MHRIDVNGMQLFAEDGVLLSQILAKAGEPVEHLCGGKGTCKKCTVWVDGKEELSCRYRIHKDISVSLPDKSQILSESGAQETGRITQNLCFALDIGTTTLALALVSLDEKQIIRILTRTNPQRAFGADVMTRIDYCRKNGVDKLFQSIISEINDMIAEFALPKVETLYVAGNTTMLHLFFGVDCSAMGAAPYAPTFLESRRVEAPKLGIRGIRTVETLPSIAAFVGADLIAGLNLVGMPKAGKHHLLVDLGTNAEILLFSEDSIVCTAAAAGPCFEGVNISCGMSATSGAIYCYYRGSIKTIDDAPPKGICGTGLFDIVAALLADGTMDETGFLEQECFTVAPNVSLSRADIRQFQAAKSAIYAAIITLMQSRKISFDNIDKLFISGGFSAKINLDHAVKTGIFPAQLRSKCVSLNNSSLLGTVKYACENNDLSAFIEKAEYIDLSANPMFTELFIENMLFMCE